VAKFAKKKQKRPKTANYSSHATSEIKNSRNAEIGTNRAHSVRMMPELFVFKLYTALIFNCGKILAQNWQTVKYANFFSTWMVAPHIYTSSIYLVPPFK